MNIFEKAIVIWVMVLVTLVVGSVLYVWASGLKKIEDIVIETEADIDDIIDCLRSRHLITE